MSDQPVNPDTPAAPEADENQIIAERRAKLAALRAKGIAYPNNFQRDHLAGDLHEAYEDHDRDRLDLNPVVVKIAGRIMGVPNVKRSVKRVLVIEQIGLVSETGKFVEQRTAGIDSFADALDAEIRSQLNGVLHRDHGRAFFICP